MIKLPELDIWINCHALLFDGVSRDLQMFYVIPGVLDPFGRGRYQPQPGIFPRPRPRFDPIGPGQEFFRPGRGGGLFGSASGRGPRFF